MTLRQAPGEARQLQGLKALQGLARNPAMFLPLQAAFREVQSVHGVELPCLSAVNSSHHGERWPSCHARQSKQHNWNPPFLSCPQAGGFPFLVKLLDVAVPPQPQGHAALVEHMPGGGDSGGGDPDSSGDGSQADAAKENGVAGRRGGGSGASSSGGASGGGASGGDGDDAWAQGSGASRISPAVEALTMLARNNPKNRWARALPMIIAPVCVFETCAHCSLGWPAACTQELRSSSRQILAALEPPRRAAPERDGWRSTDADWDAKE